MNGVDAPGLTDPLDASDALLQTNGRPWKLEIDNQPAMLVQVQPLAGGIRCEEQTRTAAGERIEDLPSHLSRNTAMQLNGREIMQVFRDSIESVAVFREHDGGLGS